MEMQSFRLLHKILGEDFLLQSWTSFSAAILTVSVCFTAARRAHRVDAQPCGSSGCGGAGETRRINSACARGDVDVGATTAISSSPTWTFALPEFFTADDVAACQWLRDLCFQALVRDDPGSGAFAQREVDEVCKTWTAAALVGMMKHGMVYVEERAEEATRFGLVSHSELVGPVMRKAIVEICSQNSGAKPASKRSRVETTKAEHSAPLLGAAASQIMEAVRRDVRLRYLPYAAMRRSIQLLCSSGDIFETAPDTYQLDE